MAPRSTLKAATPAGERTESGNACGADTESSDAGGAGTEK
jgi:hypothetical protein